MALGVTETKADSNVSLKVKGRRPVTLLLHVDDLFLIRKEELIKFERRRLPPEFKMKNLDMVHYFLGMEVWQNVDGISLG